jgi:hypothetical protein
MTLRPNRPSQGRAGLAPQPGLKGLDALDESAEKLGLGCKTGLALGELNTELGDPERESAHDAGRPKLRIERLNWHATSPPLKRRGEVM